MAEAYPLTWPEGWSRTTPKARKSGRAFKVTTYRARGELYRELKRLKAAKVILSTNIPIRKSDGQFNVDAREPQDPGVAIYFERGGKPQVLACDAYDQVGANIRAIGLTVEALRSIERYGATELLERAFTGFKALPAARPWHEIVGCSPTASPVEIEDAYHAALKKRHPQYGGTVEEFQELIAALQAAKNAGRL